MLLNLQDKVVQVLQFDQSLPMRQRISPDQTIRCSGQSLAPHLRSLAGDAFTFLLACVTLRYMRSGGMGGCRGCRGVRRVNLKELSRGRLVTATRRSSQRALQVVQSWHVNRISYDETPTHVKPYMFSPSRASSRY